jgi:hypothetical protein
MERKQFFELQIRLLEELFPKDWFVITRERKHPAWMRWNLCKQILRQDGMIRYPDQQGEFTEIARLVLESWMLIALTKGDINNLTLGSIDLYGDEAVQKKIKSRIANPEKFEDLMVELSFAAWHKSRNHDVVPWEKEGLPDMKIKVPNLELPVVAECKNLRSVSANRIDKVISKASLQIKAVMEPCYGIVVLDVSIPVATLVVVDDELPRKIQEISSIVQSALRGDKNRSIVMAILIWDDCLILGAPPDMTQIAFRRRHVRINHGNAHRKVAEEIQLFEGFVAMYNCYWRERKELAKEYIFTQQFREQCASKFRIGINNVLEAIQKYDKQESIRFNGQKEFIIFSRHIKVKEQELTLLTLCEKQDQKLIVHMTFKIYDDLCDDIHLLSPLQLLARFAGIYGLLITIGDLTSKFIMAHRITVKLTAPTQVVEIHNPENHQFIVNFLFKIDQVGPKYYANCALVFCIDTERYLNWISR